MIAKFSLSKTCLVSKVSVPNLTSNVYLSGKFWVVMRYFFENIYVTLVELAVLYSVDIKLINFLVQLCASFESKLSCSSQFSS